MGVYSIYLKSYLDSFLAKGLIKSYLDSFLAKGLEISELISSQSSQEQTLKRVPS